jgi:E3 ubiquitin-protein ligase SHPRH
MMKLRTRQLKESPIGWRRPEQTQALEQLPAGTSHHTSRKMRGEGKGMDLFKHYPTEAKQAWDSAERISVDLENLQPWVLVCESAAEAEEAAGGANAVVTDQSGFQDIQALMDSSTSQITNCPVCLEPLKVGNGPKQPVVTRCIHLFCSVCIEAHMRSFRVVNVTMAADAECQCPICRRAIRTNELVVLQPRDDGDDEDMSKLAGPTGDSASKTPLDTDAPGAAAIVSCSVGSSAPRLTLAADDANFQAIPLPRGPLLPLLPQFPAIPSRFLTHLSEAAGVNPGSAPNVTARPSGRSSKMLQLLADLDRVLYKTDNESATGSLRDAGDPDGSLRGKAVVFSQHKSVIQHASYLLKATGVRHVSICPGDNQQTLRNAVATFNSEQSCGVFLLHAGTAAAGLTLTAARHVFLLEPFLSAAEEAQAMNRAHRIGQQHRTSHCVVIVGI